MISDPESPDSALAAVRPLLDNPGAQLSWGPQLRLERWRQIFTHVPALAESHPAELIGLLIAALSAPERRVYHPAACMLRSLTGLDHGFRTFGGAEERERGRQGWDRWWQQARHAPGLRLAAIPRTTLIVDEIPGRIVGNDDEPPGAVAHRELDGALVWETQALKMPYDAVALEDGSYLVNIIRARAVWRVARDGQILQRWPVGGYPCSLQLLDNQHILVAGWDDGVPGFVREYDGAGRLVWSMEQLRWPWKAERIAGGNTLIADAGTGRVFEVAHDGREVWAVDQLGPEQPALFDALGPVYCQRLADGNTLVSIRGLSRVIELNQAGQIVWEVGAPLVATQYSAVRLWNGNTLIADQGHFRVIEIDIEGQIVWEQRGFGYPAKAYRL
jgi:hypothetical protein